MKLMPSEKLKRERVKKLTRAFLKPGEYPSLTFENEWILGI